MRIRAEQVVDGIPVNPVLPKRFWDMPNEARPAEHLRWWGVPFIRTQANEHWPGGIRFDTYCLDGGAWDRPTAWGKVGRLEEAVCCVQEGPVWRKPPGGR